MPHAPRSSDNRRAEPTLSGSGNIFRRSTSRAAGRGRRILSTLPILGQVAQGDGDSLALESRTQRVLDLLNRKLLRADPRLGQIANTLSGATRVAARDRDGSVDLRLVPLKSWDLLSKAEIILRNEPDWPWLPLQRHGQGVQSTCW
jgi:hypothetical protein